MNFQNLKDYLKKEVPLIKKISFMKRRYKCKKNIVRSIDCYKNAYIKYSTSLSKINDVDSLRRMIIINSHILEKGLSHSDYRAGFGKKIVIELQECIRKYKILSGTDFFAVENGVSILHEYHEMNKKNNFDDSDYLNLQQFKEMEIKNLSPYEVVNKDITNVDLFKSIAENRHSVRCYEEKGLSISEDTMKKVIELANTAPSACNRQATNVFAITNKNKIEIIEKIHGGCKGFGRNVSAFLFITSDLSLYSSNEAKIPSFDSGIYAMNLLYALQAYGLNTCILNGSFPGDAQDKIYEVTSIPRKYEINGLIGVYKLNPGAVCKIAASPRRSAEDVFWMKD